jgi:hypothetical protein
MADLDATRSEPEVDDFLVGRIVRLVTMNETRIDEEISS